jgi:hypothetical protein
MTEYLSTLGNDAREIPAQYVARWVRDGNRGIKLLFHTCRV